MDFLSRPSGRSGKGTGTPSNLPTNVLNHNYFAELSTVLLSGIAGLSLLFTLERIENDVTDGQLLS